MILRVYGDLFTIEGHFLSMLDAYIQYLDVYAIHCSEEEEDGFWTKWAYFIDENCLSYEVIENLSSIGEMVGFDLCFWEDEDDDE